MRIQANTPTYWDGKPALALHLSQHASQQATSSQSTPLVSRPKPVALNRSLLSKVIESRSGLLPIQEVEPEVVVKVAAPHRILDLNQGFLGFFKVCLFRRLSIVSILVSR